MRRLLIIAFGLFIGGAVIALSPATVLAQDGERAASGANNARQGQNGVNPQISNMPATQTETDEAIERSGGNPGPELTPFVPRLSVPIAGVQFTTPTIVDGKVQVPFLAQYITGIYRYALAISTIIGIIVIIIGGFYYLVGASIGDAKRGQALITDAVIGLFALYTATFVLNFINPNLTNLRPLALTSVNAQDYDYEPTGTTYDPATDSAGSPSGGTQRNINGQDGGNGGGGSAQQYTGECPISNLPTDLAGRRQAFNQQIGQYIRATDRMQRVVEAANSAANCRIYYGSCKAHAEGYRIAATGSVFDTHKMENSSFVRSIVGISCYRESPAPGCTNDGSQAKARVRGMLGEAEQNRRADMLAPGDWLWIYNGNSGDRAGQHSITFINWEGSSGRAHIVHGWNEANPSHHDTICLRPSCGNWSPITRIR